VSELEDLSVLIGDVYDAALDPGLWPPVLLRVCGFVGGAASGIFSKDSVNQSGEMYHTWGDDPEFTRLYFSKYVKFDPFTTAHFFFDVGDVISIDNIMPYDEYQETLVFKEWVKPQGYVDVATAVLEKTGTAYAALSVIRHERHGLVDDEVRKRMRLLAPHFRRAVLIGKVIDLRKIEAASLSAAMDGVAAGVFLLDASRRVMYANSAGQEMLGAGETFRTTQNALVATDQRADQMLGAVLAAAGGGDMQLGAKDVAVPLTGLHGERWLAHVLPLTSGVRQRIGDVHTAIAAMFVRKASLDAPSSLEILAKLYSLTVSELRVLQAMVEVGGVPAVAAALGISEATVKTHLHHLFVKTGAVRQADLVKLVASHASPFKR
jgi:DNA-binding CsgD family transcriptional regulator/PAS domain-containing protein